ncbi:hypothetical protein GCM10022275_16540 [Tessaracoccus defluvii]
MSQRNARQNQIRARDGLGAGGAWDADSCTDGSVRGRQQAGATTGWDWHRDRIRDPKETVVKRQIVIHRDSHTCVNPGL